LEELSVSSAWECQVMFVLARAATYSALFIGLLLIFLPGRILSSTGIVQPAALGPWLVAGMLLGGAGAALALTGILTCAFVGRGTPAPFDPPRRLVFQGPYRVVRNPMYVGAGLALAGAALFYQSIPLLGYAGLFVLINPFVCPRVRRAHVAPDLRWRVRRLLCARRPMVAETMRFGRPER
jgi:protein-S-isoprenylcysteine O-methyltransferase Ste14